MAKELDSAFWQSPPLTQFDWDVAKYFKLPIVAHQTHFVKNDSYVVYKLESYPSKYHGWSYFAGCLICLLLVTVATMTRLAIRFSRRNGRGWDDYMALAAWLFSIGHYALYMHAVVADGFGQHSRYLTYRQYIAFLQITNIGVIFFTAAVSSASMSMVMFNRRLAAQTYPKLRIILAGFAIIIVIIGISIILLSSFLYGANPGYYSFEYLVTYHGTLKFNYTRLSRYAFFSHVAIDLSLMFVPIFIILRTKISRSLKFRLCFIYALATIHCAAAIAAGVLSSPPHDAIYNFTHSRILWILIDLTLALIVINLPVINTLLPSNLGSKDLSIWSQVSNRLHARRPPITDIETVSNHELTHGDAEIKGAAEKSDEESKSHISDGLHSRQPVEGDTPSPGL